jgi:hypothetical protein
MSDDKRSQQPRAFDPRGGPPSRKERWVVDVTVAALLLVEAIWKAFRG